MVFEGDGDNVVDVSTTGTWVAHITANEAGHFCSMKSLAASGDTIDLLVNTTDPYEGIVPFDFGSTTTPRQIEVRCQGHWVVELRSFPGAVERINKGETRNGSGDDVFISFDGTTATITGNGSGHFFSVKAVSSKGDDLLVNTTDPYNGTTRLPNAGANGARFIIVKATGPWTFVAQ